MESKIKLSIFRKAFNKDISIIRVSFVLIALTSIGLAFFFSVQYYKCKVDTISKTFVKKDSIIRKAVYSLELKNKETKQMQEQFEIIGEIKKPYILIAERYITLNYSFSIFFTIFSILTGILSFIIVKKGWDNTTNYYLKSAFLISFFCSTLFGLLPVVFKTKDNVKNNLTNYNLYSGLQLDLYELSLDNKGYLTRNTKNSMDSLNLDFLLSD